MYARGLPLREVGKTLHPACAVEREQLGGDAIEEKAVVGSETTVLIAAGGAAARRGRGRPSRSGGAP